MFEMVSDGDFNDRIIRLIQGSLLLEKKNEKK